MRPILQRIETEHDPVSAARLLGPADLPVLLQSGGSNSGQSRFSFLTAFPLLNFESSGADCRWLDAAGEVTAQQFGSPWQLLGAQLARFELVDGVDLPFPAGGAFGFWGYDLKQFVEPKLGRTALNDVDFPDCRVGFYPSLVIWDRQQGTVWILATGLHTDGSRTLAAAQAQLARWQELLAVSPGPPSEHAAFSAIGQPANSTLDRPQFLSVLDKVRDYIRRGHIYQVNIAQRWTLPLAGSGWNLFERISEISPAPFSAYQAWDERALISVSPEQFLRLSDHHIRTRPIKGTRPRSLHSDEDARLSYELQSSEKERAELLMITDLLRNDLGRICEFGSVTVPDLMRLERFSHVQHLVSTVEGRLRPDTTHLEAMAACFPGGSITGAPKFRAMQIIEELEPVARGPYTGCLGYLGFNRESQLNILIRTAVVSGAKVHYHAGAGIVADSSPEAEYAETLVKAAAFFQALTARPTPATASQTPAQ